MIYAKIAVPTKLINEPFVMEKLWSELSVELSKVVGLDTNYSIKLNKRVEKDEYSDRLIVTLRCNVEHVMYDVRKTVVETHEMPTYYERRYTRWERFKQLVKGY